MPHRYNPNSVWPFLTLPVTLYPREGTNGTSTIEAQIDTGADVTIVPNYLLDEIGTTEIFPTQIRSHWGERRRVNMHFIDMEVAGQRLPGVNVVADEQGDTVLLDRSILNRLLLLLDGPGRQTDVLTRRPVRF